jgi:probable rRNA maturation factor
VSIEVANESGVAVDERRLVALARHVLDELGINPLAELSVLLVDEPAMTALNERWMEGASGPTDVLAFPMDELDPTNRRRTGEEEEEPEPTLLGDVVLCPEVARRQARRAGHAAEDELHLLTTHGILHLLGYDHAEQEDEREMFARQGELLRSWGEVSR